MFLADQQDIQPQFNGGGDTGINNGIPNVLGAEVTNAPGGSGVDCTQTGSCSCSNGSTSVTCGCSKVISCYECTVLACDTDSVGKTVNCREVTDCAGRCD